MALALLAGATVQSLVGLGLGLVAAPVLTLTEPELMPEMMLWLTLTYPFLTLASERSNIDWRVLAWAVPTRLVGTVAGVAAVASFSTEALGVVVGTIVLGAVILTWRTVRVPLNPGTLMTAGVIGGFGGTATSIGGPPLAIVLQHRPPPQIRSTMAIYFCVGSALSLTGLAIAGQLDGHRALLALVLSPTLVLGALLARALRPRIPAEAVRPVVLIVCALSATVLLVRSVL